MQKSTQIISTQLNEFLLKQTHPCNHHPDQEITSIPEAPLRPRPSHHPHPLPKCNYYNFNLMTSLFFYVSDDPDNYLWRPELIRSWEDSFPMSHFS